MLSPIPQFSIASSFTHLAAQLETALEEELLEVLHRHRRMPPADPRTLDDLIKEFLTDPWAWASFRNFSRVFRLGSPALTLDAVIDQFRHYSNVYVIESLTEETIIKLAIVEAIETYEDATALLAPTTGLLTGDNAQDAPLVAAFLHRRAARVWNTRLDARVAPNTMANKFSAQIVEMLENAISAMHENATTAALSTPDSIGPVEQSAATRLPRLKFITQQIEQRVANINTIMDLILELPALPYELYPVLLAYPRVIDILNSEILVSHLEPKPHLALKEIEPTRLDVLKLLMATSDVGEQFLKYAPMHFITHRLIPAVQSKEDLSDLLCMLPAENYAACLKTEPMIALLNRHKPFEMWRILKNSLRLSHEQIIMFAQYAPENFQINIALAEQITTADELDTVLYHGNITHYPQLLTVPAVKNAWDNIDTDKKRHTLTMLILSVKSESKDLTMEKFKAFLEHMPYVMNSIDVLKETLEFVAVAITSPHEPLQQKTNRIRICMLKILLEAYLNRHVRAKERLPSFKEKIYFGPGKVRGIDDFLLELGDPVSEDIIELLLPILPELIKTTEELIAVLVKHCRTLNHRETLIQSLLQLSPDLIKATPSVLAFIEDADLTKKIILLVKPENYLSLLFAASVRTLLKNLAAERETLRPVEHYTLVANLTSHRALLYLEAKETCDIATQLSLTYELLRENADEQSNNAGGSGPSVAVAELNRFNGHDDHDAPLIADFLRQREARITQGMADTSISYTAQPYSIANLFCLHIAAMYVDARFPNTPQRNREIWRLLRPSLAITGVYQPMAYDRMPLSPANPTAIPVTSVNAKLQLHGPSILKGEEYIPIEDLPVYGTCLPTDALIATGHGDLIDMKQLMHAPLLFWVTMTQSEDALKIVIDYLHPFPTEKRAVQVLWFTDLQTKHLKRLTPAEIIRIKNSHPKIKAYFKEFEDLIAKIHLAYTPRQAITALMNQFIASSKSGGNGGTVSLASPLATDAIKSFFYWFNALPKKMQDDLYALESSGQTGRMTLHAFFHIRENITDCVETNAMRLQSILANAAYATILDKAAALDRQKNPHGLLNQLKKEYQRLSPQEATVQDRLTVIPTNLKSLDIDLASVEGLSKALTRCIMFDELKWPMNPEKIAAIRLLFDAYLDTHTRQQRLSVAAASSSANANNQNPYVFGPDIHGIDNFLNALLRTEVYLNERQFPFYRMCLVEALRPYLLEHMRTGQELLGILNATGTFVFQSESILKDLWSRLPQLITSESCLREVMEKIASDTLKQEFIEHFGKANIERLLGKTSGDGDPQNNQQKPPRAGM